MVDLEQMKQELIRDEGVRYSAYQDSLGYWTIGVGRLIDQRRGQGLTDTEVRMLLHNDIEIALNDIAREAWYQRATELGKRGLLNMRFQLGAAGIRTFKTSLGLIAQGRFKEAGENLRKSNWFKQTPIRAERVIRQIE